MRICYIITRMDELGGPQIHVRDFSARLVKMGHEVHVIAGSTGLLIDGILANGVSCTIVPEMTRAIGFFREFVAIYKTYKTVRAVNPDIVSCHSSKAGVIGRLAAFLAGKKSIFTVHGWAFTENVPSTKRAIYTVIEWVMARFCARIITVSDYDHNLGLAAHIARAQKITTIHNGMLDYPRAKTSADICRLIMVARFAPQKDYPLLISAMADLKHLEWILNLVGNGESAAEANQIAALGLDDRIHILGQRSDVNDLLNQSDAFLLITHYEGFPRSIIEAMRAELPVIATSVAGVPEAVTSGVTGFLVPHGDKEALVRALKTLITSADVRVQMGQAGRARYEEQFTFDIMFDHTVAVYEQIIG